MANGNGLAEEHAPLSSTAFRSMEKQFMLCKPQPVKNKRKKPAPLPLPDMTHVLDLHDRDKLQSALQSGQLIQHSVPNITLYPPDMITSVHHPAIEENSTTTVTASTSTELSGNATHASQLINAYTMPHHPGLMIIPNAVPALAQLQLARACFLEYPEPPARTNHDREYGPLIGVWQAAQRGLDLKVEKRKHDSTPTQSDPYPHAAPDGEVNGAGKSVIQSNQENNTIQSTSSYSNPPTALSESTSSLQQNQQPTDCEIINASDHDGAKQCIAADNQHPSACNNGSDGSRSFDDCWCPPSTTPGACTAVKASAMLRRMRWAVLGPHYDWTLRKYMVHQEHRQLPPALVKLAQHWGNTALKLQKDMDGPVQYHPDAALINYYYEGDTLMGHADDAESDLRQPIVTLSVGCPAIFLMGGADRSVQPTPILLRSGDVVVLAGPARKCFHGVPRVLTELPLPHDLKHCLDSCDQGEEEVHKLSPILEHMHKCRINISTRAVK